MSARRPRRFFTLLAAALCVAVPLIVPTTVAAQKDLMRSQRVELAGLNRDANRLGGLIRRGKTEDASALLAEIDASLEKLKAEAGAAVTGRTADSLARKLDEARATLPSGEGTGGSGSGDVGAGAGDAPMSGEPTPANDDTPDARRTAPPAGGVTFSKDVAPTLVNVCGGCHMYGQSRGGFSMNTFEELIESGYVDPDDPEGGRMVRLMGMIEQPKMPPGNARLKRSQWENARAWAAAGAKLDVGNPRAPLRALVPTEAQKQRAAMAMLGDAEFASARLDRAKELFSLAVRRATPEIVRVEAAESGGAGGLILIGNVDRGRLEQLAGWAAEDAARFGPLLNGEPLGGRGPLTIAVMKDRFDYEEFHLGVFKRNAPPGLTFDASVPDDASDAFVVLQDLRDDPTPTDPGMRANLVAGLAAAAVEGGEGEVPAWLAAGLGPSAARQADPRNPALAKLDDALAPALRRVRKGDELLDAGTFAPAELAAVGAGIVDLLRENGGDRKLADFLKAARQTGAADGGAAALRAVYNTTPAQLTRALVSKAGRRR